MVISANNCLKMTALSNYSLSGEGAPTTVLLVGDEPAEAQLIQSQLADAGDGAFRVEWVMQLADALDRLGRAGIDVVILDLTVPGGHGLAAFDQVLAAAPNTLILVLSLESDEAIARQAVEHGAHDYLLKGHIDSHWLPRSLNYLIECKAAKEALRNSEERFRAISDASPLGIFVSDKEGDCVYTNAAYQRISGLSFEQTLETRWSMAIHPEDRQRVLADWHAAAHSDTPLRTEYRFQREDGSVVWTRVNSTAMYENKRPHGHVQTVEDITERKIIELGLQAAEEALFEEKERAQVTLNSIGDAVLATDLQGNVTYMNPVAETMTGWSGEDGLGRPLTEVFRIIDGTTREAAANPTQRAIAENRTVGLAANCVLIHRDGVESAIEDSAAPIHNREGQVTGAVIVFHDVSQSRAMTQKMTHLAQHDFLTGLPNRALMTERLSQAISLASRHKKRVALLFLDMDDFKHINDSLGHAVGDQLLQSVAQRLKTSVRNTDIVCRQGGDEFVVLLAEIEQPQDAAYLTEKLLTVFSAPHLIGGQEVHVTVSVGISVYPDDGGNVEAMMQNADTAMFHAKASGRNAYQFFREEMNTRAVRRRFVENSLRRALKRGEFLLHYQPKVDLVTGEMSGVEALIRWQDPEQGMIQPGQFVPTAEACGLIVPIGRWVLREACRQIKTWLDAGLQAVPVAINISAAEFRYKGFVDSVAKILQETGLAPDYLQLELTETILMHDAESTVLVLESLKTMGVRLAIDDFGTGYSSLSYLRRFPIDTLKIDQSFVRDITTDTDDATIVSAVIGMGKNLKQRVVAEGVETQAQLEFLKKQQCDEAQGFHFSQALTAEALGSLLGTDWKSMLKA